MRFSWAEKTVITIILSIMVTVGGWIVKSTIEQGARVTAVETLTNEFGKWLHRIEQKLDRSLEHERGGR